MKKVIHLIPYDGTGGVEVAARSMHDVDTAGLDFSVQFIYEHVTNYRDRKVTFGPVPILKAFRRIRTQKPDLVIVSLWRACIVGLLLKIFQPSLRLVLMLHSTRHAHRLDRVDTTATGLVANEWWGDSAATVSERLPGSPAKIKRVISFVTRRLHPPSGRMLTPSFMFWGRISSIKGIDRALRLFARAARQYPEATFSIIGPDGGALDGLRNLVKELGVERAVTFRGELDFERICQEAAGGCFYLQASRYEGMAMSVVEAMQLGLVPVVTSVGEIRNYCRDGVNAILIQSDQAAAQAVLSVLADPERYATLRRNAQNTWVGKPLYAESIVAACKAALADSPKHSEPG